MAKKNEGKTEVRKAIEKLPVEVYKPEDTKTKSKPKPKDEFDKFNLVQEYLQETYEFRYNLFIAKPEFKIKKIDDEFRIFTERDQDNIYNDIKAKLKFKYPRTDLESLIGSDKISKDCDPIKEYIFTLPQWDQKDRFPEFLRQIQLENNEEKDRERLNKHFTMWFCAMVASLISDHTINELALIFTGKQGRGKTRFFNSLVPKELRLYYMYSGSFNPHDKDHREFLGSKILINLDEMATLTRTDIESLKSAMSERYVVLRRAYGRAQIHLFRTASFCGSNNDERFLTDQTGNRRWLPFAIHDIDVKEDFDIGLLYAQAFYMFKNNQIKLYLDRQEIDDTEEYIEEFRFVPMEEELILANYRQPTKEELATGSGVEHLTTTEIIHKLASNDEYKKMNVNDTSLKRMGKALKALGFVKGPRKFPGLKNPRNVWAVKKVNYQDVDNPTPATGDAEIF